MDQSIIFGGSGFIGQHLIDKLKSDYINYDINQNSDNYEYCDVRKSIQLDLGTNLSSLQVDGGATQNDFFVLE